MENTAVIYRKLNGTDNGQIDFFRKQYVSNYVGRCYNNYCLAPRSPEQPPKRCSGCQLVAYCSSDCQAEDWEEHKYVCKEFPVVNGQNVLHTTDVWEDHLASLRKRAAGLQKSSRSLKTIFLDPWVCRTCHEPRPDLLRDCKCSCVCYCSKKCADADMLHKKGCSHFTFIAQNSTLYYIQYAYPFSLLCALKALKCKFLYKPTKSLTIHAITCSPSFDTEVWELDFLHLYLEGMNHGLRNLELVFVVQGDNFAMSEERQWYDSLFKNIRLCKDCKSKKINFSITYEKMQYHMFCSRLSYTEPDVVIIYGNTNEMLEHNEGDIHTEMSYRNMLYNPKTILILTDATVELVTQGIKAVNTAQPVDVLMPPTINLARGFSSTRAELESGADVTNEKYYFTCLRRNK